MENLIASLTPRSYLRRRFTFLQLCGGDFFGDFFFCGGKGGTWVEQEGRPLSGLKNWILALMGEGMGQKLIEKH